MIPRVEPGQPISAEVFNRLVDAINAGRLSVDASMELSRSPSGTRLRARPVQLDLVEFDAPLTAGVVDSTAELFNRDFAAGAAPADQWHDDSTQLTYTMDPLQSVYLTGERHLTYFHPGAGQRIPIPGLQWQVGICTTPIVPGGSGTVYLYSFDGTKFVAASLNVTAYDYYGYGVSRNCYVFQHRQSKDWFALANGPSWAVAQSDWAETAGKAYVSCKIATDMAGLSTTGSAFNVQLPRTMPGCDPNVHSGDVLAISGYCAEYPWQAASTPSRLFPVTPYLDAKVGTVRLWALATAGIPSGWALMDGTANTTGSGIDMRARFARGVDIVGGESAGTAAGADQHSHDTHTGFTTGSYTATHGVANGADFNAAGTHDHSIPDMAHSTEYNIPAYKALHYIERVH